MKTSITLINFTINKYVLFYWKVLFVLVLSSSMANAMDKLVLNTVGEPPLNTKAEDGFLDELIREILKRANYQLVITHFPAERGLRSANNGSIDGEMTRIKDIDKLYQNLIPVPGNILGFEFRVFSKTKLNLQQGWQSLENKNTAFIRGWKILEAKIPKSAIVYKTKNLQQLFSLLKRDRTDFVIYEKWGGIKMLEKLEIKNVYMLEPALEIEATYIYLHKKHKNLVPKLEKALKEMRKDGSYDKLVKKHLISNIPNIPVE